MKWFIFHNNNLLLCRQADGAMFIPELSADLLPVAQPDTVHCYDMQSKCGVDAMAFGVDSPLLDVAGDKAPSAGCDYQWMGLRETWDVLSSSDYQHAAHASVWVFWDAHTRYCSVCGSALVRHMDMGKKCPKCGSEHFPHLAPASIVRITRGDEILLVQAKNFRRPNMFGLVAGFLEGGESLEECAAREVREETGLEISNVRYFASQPWPYPSGVMVGFTADYAGGEIHMDDGELKQAGFFKRDALPEIPSPMSIARQLIDDWLKHS